MTNTNEWGPEINRGDPAVLYAAADRFWSKVDRAGGPGDCWLWNGRRDRSGYGVFKLGRDTVRAHRTALRLATGIHPGPDVHTCHSCDNRACVNPQHLRWGSRKDNMSEAAARGRLAAQRKTHCPAGHPYKGLNLYVTPKGARACVTCRRETLTRSRIRRKELAA